MPTQRNQSMVSVVSVASESPALSLAAVFVLALWVGACAGRQRPLAQIERAEIAQSTASAESPIEVLQFDNQASVRVDVYLVSAQVQWRLGRVQPGMRATLKVPESAIDWAGGFMQLAVIPDSPISAQAWRDPRAITAIAQPLSDVLSQRWTFRQPGGLPLQLQSTQLPRR